MPSSSPATAPLGPTRCPPRRRIQIGRLWLDVVSFDEAMARIDLLVRHGSGGSVFTPNVDHIVKAENDVRFRMAYERAALVLVDGTPVLWASRLLGTPLPEKVSGSDLVLPLARLAGLRKWRVYLMGGRPGTAAKAATRLREEFGVNVVGIDAPAVSESGESADEREVWSRIREARPDLVLVALGSPKQELWIERAKDALGAAVAIAVGASLEFVSGRIRRAPRLVSRLGFEWLYRLAQEPRRLWYRYLIRDPRFFLIAARTRLQPAGVRIRAGHFPEDDACR